MKVGLFNSSFNSDFHFFGRDLPSKTLRTFWGGTSIKNHPVFLFKDSSFLQARSSLLISPTITLTIALIAAISFICLAFLLLIYIFGSLLLLLLICFIYLAFLDALASLKPVVSLTDWVIKHRVHQWMNLDCVDFIWEYHFRTNVKCQKSNVKCQMSNDKYQMTNVKCQMSNVNKC